LIGLGHWMGIDERRVVERKEQLLLEARRRDMDYLITLEKYNNQRLDNQPNPTEATVGRYTVSAV